MSFVDKFPRRIVNFFPTGGLRFPNERAVAPALPPASLVMVLDKRVKILNGIAHKIYQDRIN